MNNVAGLGIFALGVVLLILGLGEVGAGISATVSPKSISFWMSVAGIASVVAGLWFTFSHSSRR